MVLRRSATLAEIVLPLLAAAVIFIAAGDVEARFVTDPVGPEGFLYIIAGGFVATAALRALIAARRWRAMRSNLGIDTDGTRSIPDPVDVRNWIITVVVLIAFLTLLPRLGYWLVAPLMVAAMTAVLGERRIVQLITVTAAIVATFWLIFGILLGAELPGS